MRALIGLFLVVVGCGDGEITSSPDGSVGPPDSGGGPPLVDGAVGAPDAAVPAGLVPAIVAVGYGGIRVVSRDDGATWGEMSAWAANGGDDENLLRAVAYGNGTWVAAGWKVVTSPDAVTWTEQEGAACNLVEGMAFGDGVFLLSCCCDAGDGDVYRSVDGVTWEATGGTVPAPAGRHPYIVHAGGQFAASGDDGASYVSPDQGVTWNPLAVDHVKSCDGAFVSHDDCLGAFRTEGSWLSTEWAGRIRRTTDGGDWDVVYDDPGENTVYDGWHPAFAAGLVPE